MMTCTVLDTVQVAIYHGNVYNNTLSVMHAPACRYIFTHTYRKHTHTHARTYAYTHMHVHTHTHDLHVLLQLVHFIYRGLGFMALLTHSYKDGL